ncbi:unnamed protein product [Cyclocybe aegerita]|uniref:Uncharacterized protein n=1 Tax=Cyclocybe aegerita TaxID=1973307 RepID=A0A8S0W0N5_CYCAE|nr:unnamed protein product [Cyclocybe aegerita]
MAFSYSGIQNPRRLECHLHAPWGLCFNDLIEDLGPETFVIAQHKLAPFNRLSIQAWRKKKEEEKLAIKMFEKQRNVNRLGKQRDVPLPSTPSESGSRFPPVPEVDAGETSEDDEGAGEDEGADEADEDEEGEDEDDTNILAELSFETLPDKRAEEKSPDFSIYKALKFRNRHTGEIITAREFPKNPADWDSVRVVLSRIRLLAELKPAPSRHSENEEDFQFGLETAIGKASHQAVVQARCAFEADERLEALVAVAVSGEWWAWKVFKREEVMPTDAEADETPSMTLSPHPQDRAPSSTGRDLEDPLPEQATASIQSTSGLRRSERNLLHGGAGLRAPPYTEFDSSEETDDETQKVPVRLPMSRKGKEPEDHAAQDAKARTVFHKAKPGHSDEAKDTIFDAIPTPGEWTNNMRLSTPVSNQAFSILHYFIEHGRLPSREQTHPEDSSNPGPPGSTGASLKRSSEWPSLDDEQAQKKQRLDLSEEDEDMTSDGCMTPPNLED